MGDQSSDATTREMRGKGKLVAGAAIPKMGNSSRYEIAALIAKGGMGEVFAAEDRQLGREVAIKRMRAANPSEDATLQFFREATIQGRLDHPAIVPVYELGVDDDNRPFFAMKRVGGMTLGERIVTRHPREALLHAFVEVCLAVEFAHARGYVHRDLKPPNIALGEYGEVYVLDWGIAHTVGAKATPSESPADASPAAQVQREARAGTYGYMSPEQLRSPSTVDARSDVYSLGCILFEILVRAPLHESGEAAVQPTLEGIDARPSLRGVEVAPELEALCVEATMVDPDFRLPSARALGERVQRFLDGDRDVAKRRELAHTHLKAARAAFNDRESEVGRKTAMREAGRALALDPSLEGPAELMTRLMLEPPRETPPEVQQAFELENERIVRRHSKIGAWGYLCFLGFLPTLLRGVGASYIAAVLALGVLNVAVLLLRWPRGNARAPLLAVMNALTIVIVARLFSPFLIAPAVAAVITMALVFTRSFDDFRAVIVLMVLMILAVLAPWTAELLGLVSPTTSLTSTSLSFFALGNQIAPATASVSLILYVIAIITAAALIGHAMRRTERTARQHMHLQAWQLAQLVR